MTGFGGFPAATRKFLAGIAENNTKEWFDAHRALYDEGYVGAGRAFVEAIGPELRKISPTVQFEPKINGSISRVNRDTRFSPRQAALQGQPRSLLLARRQEGLRTTPASSSASPPRTSGSAPACTISMDEGLTRYRDAVVDERSGKALVAAIEKVEAAGDYMVGSMPRKTVPRGYDKDSPARKIPALGRPPRHGADDDGRRHEARLRRPRARSTSATPGRSGSG